MIAALRIVACDESGAEGEKLVGGCTEVFAHAGVALTVEEAAECIRRLRELIRSPATEYKATHLLREKNRASLEWFLGPDGPVHGRAHACLIDKAYFLLRRFAEAIVATGPAAGTTAPERSAEKLATGLYREGPDVFGHERWRQFLRLLNDQMRLPSPTDRRSSPTVFFRLVEEMDEQAVREPVRSVWDLVRSRGASSGPLMPPAVRPAPEAFPALDPLGPAIEWAFARWSDGGPVTVVHDQQKTLTAARITAIEQRCGGTLRLVSSTSDPRVQIADFLAGVARQLSTHELLRRADPALTAMLRPYIDSRSAWGDDLSWSRLAPATSVRS